MVAHSRLKHAGAGSKKRDRLVKAGRRVSITVYKYDELPKETKQKVLDNHRDINTDYDWWEPESEAMKERFLNDFGLDVDTKTMSFSAERGRDWYLSIGKLYIEDEEQFVKALKKDGNFNEKELYAIKSGDVNITLPERGSHSSFNDVDLEPNDGCRLTEDEQDNLRTKIEGWLKGKEESFLIDIEKSFDYYVSDESIVETIRANEYEFTADGKIFR